MLRFYTPASAIRVPCSPKGMLTNQGLRALFHERFWKGVFPVPVNTGIGVLL